MDSPIESIIFIIYSKLYWAHYNIVAFTCVLTGQFCYPPLGIQRP